MKLYTSKKAILSTLLALTILCCSTFSFLAVSSYDVYMSQERPLVKTAPTTYNADWLEDPLVMREGLLEEYRSFYSNTLISVGNVYQERLVNGEAQLACLTTGNFDKYSYSGNFMYLSEDGNIYQLDLTTQSKSIVYSGRDAIVDLWAFDDIIFFQVGDSIYHYYVPSKTTEKLVTVEGVRAWKPLSNHVIQIIEDNPLYYDAVEASGVSEYEQPTDVAAFSSWLNQNFSLETSSESKILQQCDVQNILLASGINSTNHYWYNVVTHQELSEYTEIEQPQQVQTLQFDRASIATARSSATAISITPTVWEYPSESHFSHRTGGCVCHGHCVTGSCDCVVFDGARQCDGYARYVFKRTSGYYFSNLAQENLSISLSSASPDIWNLFKDQNLPIYMRVKTKRLDSEGKYIEHSILIYAVSSTTISICEANTGWFPPSGTTINANCRVLNYQVLSHAQFLNRYTSLMYIKVPPTEHLHTRGVLSYGDTHQIGCTTAFCQAPLGVLHGNNSFYYDEFDGCHYLMCGICGMMMSQPEPHYYDEDGYCICGYSEFWPRMNDEISELQ